MLAVLRAKFQDPELAQKLLRTGNAFLLEHSSHPGKECVWSDGFDGSGSNWLGLQLMMVRALLCEEHAVWLWLQEVADRRRAGCWES